MVFLVIYFFLMGVWTYGGWASRNGWRVNVTNLWSYKSKLRRNYSSWNQVRKTFFFVSVLRSRHVRSIKQSIHMHVCMRLKNVTCPISEYDSLSLFVIKQSWHKNNDKCTRESRINAEDKRDFVSSYRTTLSSTIKWHDFLSSRIKIRS